MNLSGVSLGSSNLGVNASANNWQLDSDINASIDQLESAVNSLRAYATSYSATSGVLETRSAFNQSMIDTLNSGADSITASDSNEDGAMLLALQTRQQIATTALSLVQDSQSAALRLFGFK
jgi:hypothetical protein